MKKVATEHPHVVSVVEVLGVGIVAVEPETVLIAFDVEHVRVAVAVGFRTIHPLKPLSFDYSQDCILFWAI